MTQVLADDNEGFDSLLRRFNKKVQADGLLSEIKRRESFEKPRTKRKKKAAATRRKSHKTSMIHS